MRSVFTYTRGRPVSVNGKVIDHLRDASSIDFAGEVVILLQVDQHEFDEQQSLLILLGIRGVDEPDDEI